MVCQWLELEADAELYSLTELHAKMVEFSGGSDVYTLKCPSNKEVIVVADDTDVLILLMHHWTEYMADVYFLSEPKKSHKKGMQVAMENMRSDCQGWNIGDITPFDYSCMDWLQ